MRGGRTRLTISWGGGRSEAVEQHSNARKMGQLDSPMFSRSNSRNRINHVVLDISPEPTTANRWAGYGRNSRSSSGRSWLIDTWETVEERPEEEKEAELVEERRVQDSARRLMRSTTWPRRAPKVYTADSSAPSGNTQGDGSPDVAGAGLDEEDSEDGTTWLHRTAETRGRPPVLAFFPSGKISRFVEPGRGAPREQGREPPREDASHRSLPPKVPSSPELVPEGPSEVPPVQNGNPVPDRRVIPFFPGGLPTERRQPDPPGLSEQQPPPEGPTEPSGPAGDADDVRVFETARGERHCGEPEHPVKQPSDGETDSDASDDFLFPPEVLERGDEEGGGPAGDSEGPGGARRADDIFSTAEELFGASERHHEPSSGYVGLPGPAPSAEGGTVLHHAGHMAPRAGVAHGGAWGLESDSVPQQNGQSAEAAASREGAVRTGKVGTGPHVRADDGGGADVRQQGLEELEQKLSGVLHTLMAEAEQKLQVGPLPSSPPSAFGACI